MATYSMIYSFTKIPMNLSFVFISDAEQGRGQEQEDYLLKNNVNLDNSQSLSIICGTSKRYPRPSI